MPSVRVISESDIVNNSSLVGSPPYYVYDMYWDTKYFLWKIVYISSSNPSLLEFWLNGHHLNIKDVFRLSTQSFKISQYKSLLYYSKVVEVPGYLEVSKAVYDYMDNGVNANRASKSILMSTGFMAMSSFPMVGAFMTMLAFLPEDFLISLSKETGDWLKASQEGIMRFFGVEPSPGT